MDEYRVRRQRDGVLAAESVASWCRVCLKAIHAGEEAVVVPYRGAHYTVCCPSCAGKFKASPREFLGER